MQIVLNGYEPLVATFTKPDKHSLSLFYTRAEAYDW